VAAIPTAKLVGSAHSERATRKRPEIPSGALFFVPAESSSSCLVVLLEVLVDGLGEDLIRDLHQDGLQVEGVEPRATRNSTLSPIADFCIIFMTSRRSSRSRPSRSSRRSDRRSGGRLLGGLPGQTFVTPIALGSHLQVDPSHPRVWASFFMYRRTARRHAAFVVRRRGASLGHGGQSACLRRNRPAWTPQSAFFPRSSQARRIGSAQAATARIRARSAASDSSAFVTSVGRPLPAGRHVYRTKTVRNYRGSRLPGQESARQAALGPRLLPAAVRHTVMGFRRGRNAAGREFHERRRAGESGAKGGLGLLACTSLVVGT